MKPWMLPIFAGALLAVSACGSNDTDRAVSGGAMGAGLGLVAGPVGAVVGGAAGATAGALTNEEQIDLGEPVWR